VGFSLCRNVIVGQALRLRDFWQAERLPYNIFARSSDALCSHALLSRSRRLEIPNRIVI